MGSTLGRVGLISVLGSTFLLSVPSSASAQTIDCEFGAEDFDPTLTTEELPHSQPWELEVTQPERSWIHTQGNGVTVAVIDSGVDQDHPQLEGRVAEGSNFLGGAHDLDGDGDERANFDCVGHGTGAAGLIAGEIVGDSNVHGQAPAADIYPIRVSEQVIDPDEEDEDEQQIDFTPDDFADAVEEAIDAGVDIINFSLKYSSDHDAIRSAIADAYSADILMVASAGNDHIADSDAPDIPAYPAAYDGVIGVTAVDRNFTRVESSQIGEWVDLAAPGMELTTGTIDGRWTTEYGGTSGAAAIVSGAAALVRSQNPDWTVDEVREHLFYTAAPVPGGRHSEAYGYGMIDVYRAVTEDLASPDTRQLDLPDMEVVERDPFEVQKDEDFAVTFDIARATFWLGVLAILAMVIVIAIVRRVRKFGWRSLRNGRPLRPGLPDEGEEIRLFDNIRDPRKPTKS